MYHFTLLGVIPGACAGYYACLRYLVNLFSFHFKNSADKKTITASLECVIIANDQLALLVNNCIHRKI